MKVLSCLFVFLVSAAVLVIADPGIIQLQETSIDASQLSVLENQELISSPTSTGKYQFIIQPQKNFSSQEFSEINSIGISLIGIIPPNAYIMLASKEDVALLKNRFDLLYAGEYLPEYKTEMAFAAREESLNKALKGYARSSPLIYNPDLWASWSMSQYSKAPDVDFFRYTGPLEK